MKNLSLCLLFAFFTLSALAGKPGVTVQNFMEGNSKALVFTENKGQLADENGKLLPDIKYYGKQGGVMLYMRAGRLSFVFTKHTEEKEEGTETKESQPMPDKFKKPGKTTIETARMDMEFLNANPNPQIVAEEKQREYTNYYLAHTPEAGITNVTSFKRLIYKNIYPNTDLVLISKNDKLEYEFVVYPGGEPKDIKIKWSGTEQMLPAQDGGIHYTNTLGEINESKPVCYNASSRVISSSFNIDVKNNTVGFNVGTYNKSLRLVIDPTLSWGTYFGGSGDESSSICWASLDDSENVCMTGSTGSSSGIATSGAFKTTISAFGDAFVTKFNKYGALLWSTYFGGNLNEGGYGIINDSTLNIYVVGTTASSNGITSSGAFQTSKKGGTAAFIVKFSSIGIRQWSTFFGGNITDYGYGIFKGDSNYFYITGGTKSTTGIATSGTYQTSFAGGTEGDGFIAKFNNAGNRIWATYFGGSSDDYAWTGCYSFASGDLYITGTTTSTNNIASSGAFRTSLSGLEDSYLAKFNTAGQRIWSTYYGGIGSDNGRCISIDANDFIYLSGSTESKSGMSTSGSYQTINGGSDDGFISKFNNTGQRIWATYFGDTAIDVITSTTIAKNGNILLCGLTASTKKMASSGSYQSIFGGGTYDAFITQLTPHGNLIWSTYYGKSGSDEGYSIYNFSNGNTYLIGSTHSSTGMATSGSYQSTGAGGWDEFVAQFSFGLSTPINIANDTTTCSGTTINLGKTAISSHTYAWTSKPAGFTSTQANPTVSPTSTTTYYLTESDSTGSGMDSVVVTVNALPIANAGPDKNICQAGTYVQLGVAGNAGYDYKWSQVAGGFASTVANPIFKPAGSGTYVLMVTDTLTKCGAVDSVKIAMGGGISTPYGTYFGGSGSENGIDITHDKFGNTYILGQTNGSITISSGAYQTSNAGGLDAFLIKINCSGQIEWSTYYGGTGDEFPEKIKIDAFGNIYFTGSTSSTSGIATVGVYQTSNAGGGDVFIAKFSNSGTRLWATYYGGNSLEEGKGISLDPLGNIFITGLTWSYNNGIATPGAYQNSFIGTQNGFLAKFDSSGNISWGTYYGDAILKGNGLCNDDSGNVYLTGYTTSSNIATSGAYQTANNGGYDAFLTKFSNSGKRLWATIFGGNEGDYGYDVLTDKSGYVYIKGQTSSLSNITTSNAYQTSISGISSYDIFLAKFNYSGSIIWSTYYGGYKLEGGQGLSVDDSGNVYITGSTISTSQIATPASYQSTFSGVMDGFLAKFNKSGSLKWASYFGGNSSDFTHGVSVDGSGTAYIVGTTSSNSNIATSGALQSSFGGVNDAFLVKISFPGVSSLNIISDTTLCPNIPIALGSTAISGHTYAWSSRPAGFTSTLSNPTATPALTTTYYLSDFDSTGSRMDSVVVTVNVSPKAVAINQWKEISAGTTHTVAIKQDGTLWNWGDNSSYGQLGNGTNPNRNLPIQIGSSSDWKSISASTTHTLAIKTDGTLWAWGNNNFGQLGDGTNTSRNKPTQIGNATNWQIISAGMSHSVAIKSDGSLWAWGYNYNGALGDGTNIDRNSPKQIGSGTNWKSVATGAYYTLAIKNNGTLWAWGTNSSTFGDGTNTSSNIPIQVGSEMNWKIIAACGRLSAAIKTDGSLWTWGQSTLGGLGDGSLNSSRNSPGQIGDDNNWQSISNGDNNSIAIKKDGTLWAWGDNTFGQLGDGTTTHKTTPVKIGIGTNWQSVSRGYHSIALKSDGTLWAWGWNKFGQVGDTTNIDRLSPVQIGNIATICAGSALTIGIPSISGYSYVWGSVPTGLSSTSAQPIVSPNFTTKYFVTVSANGCISTDTGTIRVTPFAKVNTVKDTAICSSATVSIGSTAVSGSSYTWTSKPSGYSNTNSNPSVSPANTTTYYLTATNANGCSGMDSVVVTVNALPLNLHQVQGMAKYALLGIYGKSAYYLSKNYIDDARSALDSTYLAGGHPVKILDSNTNKFIIDAVRAYPGFTRSIMIGLNDTAKSGQYRWHDGDTATYTNWGPGEPNHVSGVEHWVEVYAGKTSYTPAPSPYTWNDIKGTGLMGGEWRSVLQTENFLNIHLPVTVLSKPQKAIINILHSQPGIKYTLHDSATLIKIGGIYNGNGDTLSMLTDTISSTRKFKIYAQNSFGCSIWLDTTISIQSIFCSSPIPHSNDTSICGPQLISIKAFGSMRYRWYDADSGGTLLDTNANYTFLASKSDTFYVAGYNGICESERDTVIVRVNPSPTPNAGKDTSICSGATVSIGSPAISGSKYTWTSRPSGYSNTNSNPSVSPANTTIYSLTETNANGCSGMDSVVVTVNPNPVANAGKDTSICSGATISIGSTAISGSTYTWTSKPSGFSNTNANPSVSPSNTTTYYVTETNANGCIGMDSVLITVNPNPVASAGNDTAVCSGSSVNIGGKAVTGSTYAWTSNPSGFTSTGANPSVSPSSKTTYYVTETNAAGCKGMDSVVVSVNPLPAAKVIKAQKICSGSAISLGDTAVAGHKYAWSSSPAGFASTLSNPTANPKVATTYFLTETDTLTGCKNFNSVAISINAVPVPNPGKYKKVCSGSPVFLGTAPIPGRSYKWTSIPTGFTSTASAPIDTPAVTTTYYLTETINATGCSKTDTVTIVVQPGLTVIKHPDDTICAGDSIQLGGAGVATAQYFWLSTGSFISTIPNPVDYPTSNTTYYIIAIDTVTSCFFFDSVHIAVAPALGTAVTGATLVCAGATYEYTTPINTGSKYKWVVTGGTIVSGAGKDTITVSWGSAGSGDVSLWETSAGGCMDSNQQTITIYAKPAPKINGSVSVCTGGAYSYKTAKNTGSTYTWSITGGTINSGSGTDSIRVGWAAAGSGSLRVIESNPGGCKDTSTIAVTINALPAPKLSGNVSLCKGVTEAYKTAKNTGSTYTWKITNGTVKSGAGTDSLTVNWPNPGSGKVLVTETNAAGCKDSSSLNITINPNPKPIITGKTNACAGDTLLYSTSSSAGSAFAWSMSSGSIISGINNDTVQIFWPKPGFGVVKVIETTSTGCKDSITQVVTINKLPNAKWTSSTITGRTIIFHATDSLQAKYNWDFGDTLTDTGYATTHKYVNNGFYIVQLKVTNAAGCSAADTSIIKVMITGLTEIAVQPFIINISPNPFHDQTLISYTLPKSSQIEMQLYDMQGRKIATLEEGLKEAGKQEFLLNSSGRDIPAGAYIIRLNVNGEMVNKQVVRVE